MAGQKGQERIATKTVMRRIMPLQFQNTSGFLLLKDTQLKRDFYK